jgi:hypothetical protein
MTDDYDFTNVALGKGGYWDRLGEALRAGGLVTWMLVLCWLTLPVLVQTAIHPIDGSGFIYFLMRGAAGVPGAFTAREVLISEIVTFVAIVVCLLFQMGLLAVFYRRAGDYVPLWPLPLLGIGVIGSGIWYLGLGPEKNDFAGLMVGTLPFLATLIGQLWIEPKVRNFLDGHGS